MKQNEHPELARGGINQFGKRTAQSRAMLALTHEHPAASPLLIPGAVLSQPLAPWVQCASLSLKPGPPTRLSNPVQK